MQVSQPCPPFCSILQQNMQGYFCTTASLYLLRVFLLAFIRYDANTSKCQPVTKKQVFFLLFYFYYFWFAVKQHSAQESGFKALSNKNHSKFIKKNISIFCEKLNQKVFRARF